MVGDTSGYIVNRLLVPYLLDGIAALEARVAPAESIDTAMSLGCGHPMGPLALADAIGLDVVYAMAKTMHQELDDRRFSPPALLRRLVLNGHLGKKSKLGIYDYTTDPPRENRGAVAGGDPTRSLTCEITRIDHVAVCVADLDERLPSWLELLGLLRRAARVRRGAEDRGGLHPHARDGRLHASS